MSKVLAVADLHKAARDWRAEGATIVLASGCFDPIHPGHIEHLEAARRLGNVLVVGVASDRIVHEYKQKPGGPKRPFMHDENRASVVAGLRCVDVAAINDGPCEIIEAIKPHVYVKGLEYQNALTPDLQDEIELLTQYGGRMVFLSGKTILSSSAMLGEVCLVGV